MIRLFYIITTWIFLLLPGFCEAQLIISEYFEGTSNNKCIEIFNNSGSAINLGTGYNLKVFSNGSASGTTINLTGTIPSCGTYVVCNSSAAAAFLAISNQTSGSLSHNGDDAIGLYNGSTLLDLFGDIGCDPGAEWNSLSPGTEDGAFIRNAGYCDGVTVDPSGACNTSSFTSFTAANWSSVPITATGNLGSHTNSCPCGAALPEIQLQNPVGTNQLCAFTYTYPTQTIGSSATADITILNNGTADLTITSILLSGNTAYSIVSLPSFPLTIVPGGSQVITVQVSSAVVGTFNETLTISSNDADEGSCTTLLSATFIDPTPELQLQQPVNINQNCGFTYSFGTVTSGNTGTGTFTISNATGTAPLIISNLSLSGSTAFSFSPAPSLPITIPAGGSTSFDVIFSPFNALPQSGQVLIVNNDSNESNCTINLSGLGDGIFNCSTPIWFEDFSSYPNGTQTSARWTTAAGNCDADGAPGAVNGNYFGVDNGEFRVNDIEGLTCCGVNTEGQANNWFLTEDIDITGQTEVSISITARVTGDVECSACGSGGDYFIAEYQVDSGPWIGFYTICGASSGFTAQNCVAVPNGTRLKIRITIGNQANDENYFFDDIYVCPASCTEVLPTSLLSFNGKWENNESVLTWKTATEQNNSHFRLFHSADGKDFNEIGKVTGTGNSSEVSEYRFTHLFPHPGINYYKLISTDFDGTDHYKGIVAVEADFHFTFFNSENSSLEFAYESDIDIFSMEGKLIYSGLNVNTLPFSHSGLFIISDRRSGITQRLLIPPGK